MKRTIYYLHIWLYLAKYAFLAMLSQRLSFVIFFIGKVIRFGMYFLFLSFLLQNNNELAGLTGQQVLFIFLTFTLLDSLAQFLFREVYRFRALVVSGGFDLVLTKPVSALFRALFAGADIIDAATLPPLIAVVIFVGASFHPSLLQIMLYLLLLVNGLIIAAAFHIAVLALGIITMEIDHTVMIYRDIVALGRFPIDIYKEPLKSILTFVIPVALMVTIPAKAFFNITNPQTIGVTLLFGIITFVFSLKFWQFALSKYTSASS
jgi:ABC-2 type transport system permease protein